MFMVENNKFPRLLSPPRVKLQHRKAFSSCAQEQWCSQVNASQWRKSIWEDADKKTEAKRTKVKDMQIEAVSKCRVCGFVCVCVEVGTEFIWKHMRGEKSGLAIKITISLQESNKTRQQA